jgi:protoporphyrinogen oxidase
VQISQSTSQDQVVIIGAGPAGLSAAHELVRKSNKRVLVLESDEQQVGGLARTCTYHGFRFDLGGHRFYTKNKEVEALWTEWLGDDFLTCQRLSRIYFDGKFFDYPIRLANVMRNLGFRQSLQILLSYTLRRIKPRRPELSFQDWVANRFGDHLFDMFFKVYTEKVWGVSCQQLSADWASQRIQNLSIPGILASSLDILRENTVKTLIKSFHYPKLGPGMMWERVQEIVEDNGGKVLLGKKVVQIRHSNGFVQEVTTQDIYGRNDSFSGTHFISSMPLRSLLLNLDPPAPLDVQTSARSLNYRDFLVVVLIIEATDLFPDNWIYVHDPQVRVGRIQNFRNWSPHLIPEGRSLTSLGLEYFCTEGDDLWQEDDIHLLRRGEQELRQIGLLRDQRVVDGTVMRVYKAYPIYDEDYKKHITIIRDYLAKHTINLQVIGRNGMHRYNNQDHAVLTGLLAARNVLDCDFDVWKVNVDAVYLEAR